MNAFDQEYEALRLELYMMAGAGLAPTESAGFYAACAARRDLGSVGERAIRLIDAMRAEMKGQPPEPEMTPRQVIDWMKAHQPVVKVEINYGPADVQTGAGPARN